MRSFLLFVCSFLVVSCCFGQQVTEPDKSPMDMSYSPQGYPVLKFQNKQTSAVPNGRIIYSRPQLKGRNIFGGELKYGELWRLGANESTELELYKPAVIGAKKLPKGRYTIYCIPQETKWTIVINKDTDSWGGFNYNPDLDVVRTTVNIVPLDNPVEYLTMYFDTPNNLVIMWANIKVNLPILFAAK